MTKQSDTKWCFDTKQDTENVIIIIAIIVPNDFSNKI